MDIININSNNYYEWAKLTSVEARLIKLDKTNQFNCITKQFPDIRKKTNIYQGTGIYT